MNSKIMYATYLNSYLNQIKEKSIYNTENYFISFCDVDTEIFEVLNYEENILGSNIIVLYLNTEDYYTAVNSRNDVKKDKIIILTSKSIKQIDSLKHFSEFPIIPRTWVKNENEIDFFDIIVKMYNFDYSYKDKKKYAKFFNTILQYKQPTISEMLYYVGNCIDLNLNKLDDNKLNYYLFLLNCWSVKDNNLLQITMLKKIIRNSDIIEITNRLENVKNSLIKKYVYERKFEKLLKMGYHKVEIYFKNNIRRKSIEKYQDVDETQWIYSYDSYIEEYDSNNIENYESEKFVFNTEDQNDNNHEAVDEEYHLHLIDTMKCFNNYRDIFDITTFKNSISDLCIKVMEHCTNIEYKDKNQLQKMLDTLNCEFSKLYSYLYESKGNIKYPFLLHNYVNLSKTFAEVYFNILQFIYTHEHVSKVFNAFGLIEEFQNIFIVNKGNACIMPFYHPIFIMYLCKLQKNYLMLVNQLSSYTDGIQINLLIRSLNNMKRDFPIQYLYKNKKLYQVETNNLFNNPFYIQFSLANHNSSIKNVDTNIVFNRIYNFIENNPYISQMKILIIGDLDLDKLRLYENRIKKYVDDDQFLLDNIIITLVPGNKEQMRKQLDENLSNEIVIDKIKFKFSYLFENLKENFYEIVKEQHLVIFLDSQILYIPPYLQDKKYDLNNIKYNVVRNTLDQFINDYIENKNTINYLWEGLHNALINQSAKLVSWISTDIDSSILDMITTTVRNIPGFEVTVFSSNVNIKEAIYLKNSPNYSSYDNRGNELICVNFSVSNENRINVYNVYNHAECMIPLENFIKIVDIVDTDSDILSELNGFFVKFVYEKNQLFIKGIVPNKYAESTNEMDLRVSINNFLNFIYNINQDIFKIKLKEICAFQTYSHCKNYADIFLCHYLQNKFNFHENMDISIAYMDICDENNFDYFKAKKFVNEFLDRSIFSEGSISEYFKYYDEPNFIYNALECANIISPLNDWYLQQIEKLIEGVKKYD